MKNKLEYILFLSFSILFKILGLRLSRKFSFVIAVIFYYLIPIRKSTVIENLTNAFPEYDRKRIREIAFKNYESFAITLTEILSIPWMSRDDIEKQVNCLNKNLIIEKYNENKGVILLSAHFGNWEYVATSVAAQLNIPFSVVVKPQRNPYVTNWMNRARTKWNNKIVPLGLSIRQTYQTLKEKQVVAMVADQRGPEESIRINFFGRNISVHTGPAVLALKTGAPILYGVCVRCGDFSYKTEIVEIKLDDVEGTTEEKVKEISQRHMTHLETFIRQFPEQWLWMHKRWKH
ncbi:MAG: lysophospholipid acyltransferase family protein [Ignavibacteria bacterium]|jgi:KDO2-lipid IV(A) lauroyltransferase